MGSVNEKQFRRLEMAKSLRTGENAGFSELTTDGGNITKYET